MKTLYEDIRNAEIGYVYSQEELKQFKTIYGGVSWPGENPGFAVVLGMDKREHFDSHDIYLLDEYESWDMWELVKQCGALDFKYKPKKWVGDGSNDASDRLVKKMNAEFSQESRYLQRRRFSICSTPIIEMENLYQYLLAEIKRLRDPKRRLLHLKQSEILNYLGSIEKKEMAKLELGSYPAIEAMAFAVLEMIDNSRSAGVSLEQIYKWQRKYGMCD